MLLPFQLNGLNLDSATAVAVVSGTLDGSTETDIVNGGRTIIITLTNDTWVAAGTGPIGSTAVSQAIIDGIVSAQSEAAGWNAVRSSINVTDLVRTSDTVATLALPALAYDITADEVLTDTVPGTALTGASQIVATPTIGISAVKRGGGRIRAPKRYVVEVDKQIFFVNTISEAEALLARVRELADESAERDVTEPVTPKPPRIKVRTGTGKKTTSQALQREVKKTQTVVRQAYNRRAQSIAQDIEISRLLLEKLEKEARDDEQAIISLLLM